MPDNLNADTGEAVDKLDHHALELANALAVAHAMPLDAAYDALMSEFVARVKGRSPAALAGMDGRTSKWRVRVRLYRTSKLNEPEADSDPDLPADQLGATICAGLPAVATHLIALAAGYHGQSSAGLDTATLHHRLKSLRPTLSRRQGNAAWRVPYSNADGEWMARVDIAKVI